MSLIALDARKYFDFGIGTYIRHLIGEYASMRSDHRFILYLAPEDVRKIAVPEGWETCVIPYGKYSLSEMMLLGRQVKARNVGVYHSPHYTLPIGLSQFSVVTIHDLIHLRFPEFFSPLQRAYSFMMIRHAIKDSQFVITDSEYTKMDILRMFPVKEERIIPIHLGVSEIFKAQKEPSSIERFRLKFGLQREYILFVGNTKPHKGLHTLLEAFALIMPAFPNIELAFVGGSFAHDQRLAAVIDRPEYAGKIRSLGSLEDEDLVHAYNGAEMLVLPSLYEGFGLPPLEAMACGTPVIVSTAASLPEVVGDAALLCEPGNAGAFADAMKSLLRDSGVKKRMIEKGRERVKNFSWHVTAKKTMDVYEKIG